MTQASNMERKVTIDCSLNALWDFFADPRNNQQITPPGGTFTILTKNLDHIYPGLIVEHLDGIGNGQEIYAMTEITQVEPYKYFVDIHHYGMFKFWHHQHHFAEVKGGAEMHDIIHFEVSSNFPGSSDDARAMLTGLFDYRDKKLAELLAGK